MVSDRWTMDGGWYCYLWRCQAHVPIVLVLVLRSIWHDVNDTTWCWDGCDTPLHYPQELECWQNAVDALVVKRPTFTVVHILTSTVDTHSHSQAISILNYHTRHQLHNHWQVTQHQNISIFVLLNLNDAMFACLESGGRIQTQMGAYVMRSMNEEPFPKW
jgi:hypothetical protein